MNELTIRFVQIIQLHYGSARGATWVSEHHCLYVQVKYKLKCSAVVSYMQLYANYKLYEVLHVLSE